MSGYESPEDAELRIVCERAIAGLDAMNERLRAMNDRRAGRRPRPELKLIQGGRAVA